MLWGNLDGWGGGFKREGIYGHIRQIHFVVQQKLTLHCKVTISQLKNMYPEREIIFIEVNTDVDEIKSMQDSLIPIMKPNDTVMEVSVATAMAFVTRGIGIVDGKDYKCKSKIVICGQGADEQFGGYANQVLMQFPNCLIFYGGLSIVYVLPYIEPEWIKYENELLAKQEEKKRLKLEKKLASRV